MIETETVKKKYTPDKKYTCIDCQERTYRSDGRCKACYDKFKKRQEYLTNYPATIVYIEEIHRGKVLLTAQRNETETKIYYFQDIVLDVIHRLRTDEKLIAYTFDPQVYDSKQSGKAITITKKTKIVGA
jgi:hypothetical protein